MTAIRVYSALINMSGENSTEDLLKQLLATVNTLQKDVNNLKAKDDGRTYPQKRRRNDDSEGDESHDGDSVEDMAISQGPAR